MPHKVLVVEDDAAIREALTYNLTREGYEVESVGDGAAALAAARTYTPDVLILDLMLPGMDGFEVTRALRKDNNVPILMLTARDDEIDRVLGLEMGADDYLTKPFSMRELLARVKAMLRRVEMEHSAAAPRAGETVASGNLIIDKTRHEVTLDGSVLDLKPKEFELLLFLMQNRGRAYTREQLLEQVWGWEFSGGSRTVDVHVRWLRSRIEADAENPQRIITVRGVGYRFEG
ncbi:MAG TPA: response regulator transcription factor [Anaerolineales bacterium]|nr:response regulator transcription factor [Anaerolineales bacterium]HRQ93012.1 response regulator transcription factor [Anaerolineales bacterium]